MRYQKWQFLVIPNKDIIKGKNPALQCIYMWICSYANEDWECYPSISRLEEDCDCSKNTVLKYIKELVKLWILVKENRFKSNEQISNLYNIIIVDKIGGCNGWTGGSATDELPSAADELGGSATDEHRTKSTSLTKSNNNDYSSVENYYNNLIEGWYIDKHMPWVDHDWIKQRIEDMLLIIKTKKYKIPEVPKTHFKDWNKNKSTWELVYTKKKIKKSDEDIRK